MSTTSSLRTNVTYNVNDAIAFALANDRPKAKPREFHGERGVQKVLFGGLDCLPDQQDLFATDGECDERQSY